MSSLDISLKYLPQIIQAGMGIAVSNWKLANTVARTGQMGVVSGTAIDSVLVRRLQLGDQGGHIRRALSHFPKQEMAQRVFHKYYIENKDPQKPFASLSMLTANLTVDQQELLIIANFVEVFLAKEGHAGPVGVNYLEKVQFPVLPSLYGALLAGADYIIMGAGIPKEIPYTLDQLVLHKDVDYKLYVMGATGEDNFKLQFSPKSIMGDTLPQLSKPLKRPKFLAVISSTVLAHVLSKKTNHPVDGFVIEAPSAGGHNAPPRGKIQFNERNEPIYGPRDLPDFQEITSIGLPFWLAGSRGTAEGLKQAQSLGAQGIQVGTAFALCEESGLDPVLKNQMIEKVLRSETDIYTDPLASPTGFPFKVSRMAGTLSEDPLYQARTRVCDLGYLRDAYKKEDGSLGYRCASEPTQAFVQKGGKLEETTSRKCLCNALMADIGLGQIRKNSEVEKPLLTMGDDVTCTLQFLQNGRRQYSASDVLAVLLSKNTPS